MIIDARNLPQGETVNCDVCIVGAGAAGITLACELRDKGMQVVLLESGGMKFEKETQDLNKGEVVDSKVHGTLEENRRRYLGGATTAWGGRCVPFDEIDFEPRSYVPYSGWPFTKRDLDPYYERAHAYCEIGPYTYEVKDVLPHSVRNQLMISGFASEDVSVDKLYLFSPPTDFGKVYIDSLKNSANIKVFIYANCASIGCDREANQVSHLNVVTPRKNEFRVKAKQYILAGGGLEVTRLLLLSNDTYSQGIGNHSDLLGRFYMCHMQNHIELKFKVPIVGDYEKNAEGTYCLRAIEVKEEKQRQYQLLNSRGFMERPDLTDPSHGNGVLSAAYLAKNFLSRQKTYKDLGGHLKNIVFDLGGVLLFSQKWLNERILSERKLPSVLFKSKANIYTIRIDFEQAPNPESRLTLSESKDAFGFNRLKADWKYTDLDVESATKTTELIGKAIVKSGTGEVRRISKLEPRALGGHHIGTTRMASDPSSGVVDENCLVHGLSNLYIASSSVFPTCGYANPTLTIVAIAIRLGDYIKRLYA